MGGGLESRCVGGVYGAEGARHHPHRTHDLHSGSQDAATQHLMLLMIGACTRNMSSYEYINKIT